MVFGERRKLKRIRLNTDQKKQLAKNHDILKGRSLIMAATK